MLDIEKGSLTTMIDQLEDMGFVKRTADPNDRRKLLLSLSEMGREQMDKSMEQYTQSVVDMFVDSLRYIEAFMKRI